jgi:hypothetical protein
MDGRERAAEPAFGGTLWTSVTGRFFAHVLAREVRAIGTFRTHHRSATASA